MQASRQIGPSQPACRRDWAIAGALFMVTLALRLLFLLRSQDTTWPHSVLYEGDAPVWVRWAALLDAGQSFEDDLPFRTPGVAFLLRWIGAVAPPFTGAKVVWCVLSAATPALLHLVMVRRLGRIAAIVAALLTAVSFGSFALASSLNNEVPYTLLLVGILGLTLRWVDGPRAPISTGLGLMHGACLLLRAEHLALLVMLEAWSATVAWRRGMMGTRAVRELATVGAVALLTCVPWMLRSHAAVERFNAPTPLIPFESRQPPWTPGAIAMFRALPGYAQSANFAFLCDLSRRGDWSQVDEAAVHDFFEHRWGSVPEPLASWSLVSLKGPLDFALGNDLRGEGGFSRAALADAESPDPPFALARPSHAHLVNHGYAVGWASIRSDPARWSRLAFEKLRRFIDGATLGLFPADWPHAAPHVRQPIDIAVAARGDASAWNASMLALMGVGAIAACRLPGGGALLVVLAYRLLVVVAFYGYARHAASIGPVLFALTGLAVQWIVGMAARVPAIASLSGAWRGAGIAACAATLAAAVIGCWNTPEWFGRPAVAGGIITPTPHWHPDAFEAVDAIAIEPMPASAR